MQLSAGFSKKNKKVYKVKVLNPIKLGYSLKFGVMDCFLSLFKVRMRAGRRLASYKGDCTRLPNQASKL